MMCPRGRYIKQTMCQDIRVSTVPRTGCWETGVYAVSITQQIFFERDLQKSTNMIQVVYFSFNFLNNLVFSASYVLCFLIDFLPSVILLLFGQCSNKRKSV